MLQRRAASILMRFRGVFSLKTSFALLFYAPKPDARRIFGENLNPESSLNSFHVIIHCSNLERGRGGAAVLDLLLLESLMPQSAGRSRAQQGHSLSRRARTLGLIHALTHACRVRWESCSHIRGSVAADICWRTLMAEHEQGCHVVFDWCFCCDVVPCSEGLWKKGDLFAGKKGMERVFCTGVK